MNRLLPFAVLLAAVAGCTRPNAASSPGGAGAAAGPKADPWETAARAVKKDGTAGGVTAALRQLGNELAGRPDLSSLPALAPSETKALAAVVPLSPADEADLAGAGFTGLDAVYVADCLYLLDAARSAAPPELPPADRARAGFDWVCRQVYTVPAAGRALPPVPPTAALRRGYGSGLERAYVFLALLQQMGLDGCLVGPPAAAGQPSGAGPRGPFGAVGARVGGDVLLFDPWRGAAVPGPGGRGVATLAQLKADGGLLQPAEGGKGGWPATADEAKAAVPFLAVPVSGLSPRMAALDAKLRPALGVRLAVDPKGVRDGFKGDPPAAVWNPPADPTAYGRVLATFTPAEAGGQYRGELHAGQPAWYVAAQLPPTITLLPPELTAEPARDRLKALAAFTFQTAFLAPPTPRERLQRGQFTDASRALIDRQDGFTRGLERLAGADGEQFRQWCQTANDLYDQLRAVQVPDPLNPAGRLPDTDPAVADMRGRVDDFWRASAAVVQKLVDRAVAGVGRAEAAYLLALAKHEEAERKGGRAGGAAAAAWAEAANAWAGFLDQSAARAYPGRVEHARALADRARAAAGK